MKDVFSLRIGDTSGDGHGIQDVEHYRWTGNLDELEMDDAAMAFDQVHHLGLNTLGMQGRHFTEKKVDKDDFDRIVSYVSSYDPKLASSLLEEPAVRNDAYYLNVDSFIKLHLAIATVGYGGVLPIRRENISTIELGGYDLFQ